jgi:hypothetical protein
MADELAKSANSTGKISLENVLAASKKNGHADDLQKITGEFVVNFPHNKMPSHINLGALLEVSDIGTGLMMVKREVFDKVEKAFPENVYLMLSDEETGARRPIHMFFQAGLDEESKTYNPGGFPDYIPEDYAFVRMCRKAGVRIWLAPFMQTTHMGTFIYTGDMPAVASTGGRLRS